MNAFEILSFFGECGWFFKHGEIPDATIYLEKMMEDKRILAFDEKDGLNAILLFSVCEDYVPFYRKGSWVYGEHDIKGECIFIEHIVSKKFSLALKNQIEHVFAELFPHFKYAVWRRYRNDVDKKVIIQRRHYEEV